MTFKDLTFKKKVEHIWEYYKWMILGIIFVVFAGGSMVYAMFFTPQSVNYAGIAVYGEHMSIDGISSLTSDINSALGISTPNSVTISNYYFDENDSVFNVDMEQKFITYLYSLEIHTVISNTEYTEQFIDSEYIAPLSDYLTEDELAELDGEGLVLYRNDPLDNTEQPFAIDISASSLLGKYNVFEGNKAYFSIVPVKGFEDNTKSLVGVLTSSIQ